MQSASKGDTDGEVRTVVRHSDDDVALRVHLAADLVADARRCRELDRRLKRPELLLDPRFDKRPQLRSDDAEAAAQRRAALEAAEVRRALDASARDAEEARRRAEEDEIARVVALSQAEAPSKDFDDDEIARALQASLDSAGPHSEYIDDSDTTLWHAALQASRIDLGARGPSVVAKIIATGDTSMGQQHLLTPVDSMNPSSVGSSVPRRKSAGHPVMGRASLDADGVGGASGVGQRAGTPSGGTRRTSQLHGRPASRGKTAVGGGGATVILKNVAGVAVSPRRPPSKQNVVAGEDAGRPRARTFTGAGIVAMKTSSMADASGSSSGTGASTADPPVGAGGRGCTSEGVGPRARTAAVGKTEHRFS